MDRISIGTHKKQISKSVNSLSLENDWERSGPGKRPVFFSDNMKGKVRKGEGLYRFSTFFKSDFHNTTIKYYIH